MIVVLERQESGDQGTFGRLFAGPLSFFTGELPWRNNASNVSCIPPGRYDCRWTFSPRFRRNMYILLDTHPRAGIRKHSANLMGDKAMGYRAQLNGCIALGERLGWLDGQKALLVSAPAMRKFESYMAGKPFTLEIRQ